MSVATIANRMRAVADVGPRLQRTTIVDKVANGPVKMLNKLPASGLEPEPLAGQGFKPCTSTNFVIQAKLLLIIGHKIRVFDSVEQFGFV